MAADQLVANLIGGKDTPAISGKTYAVKNPLVSLSSCVVIYAWHELIATRDEYVSPWRRLTNYVNRRESCFGMQQLRISMTSIRQLHQQSRYERRYSLAFRDVFSQYFMTLMQD